MSYSKSQVRSAPRARAVLVPLAMLVALVLASCSNNSAGGGDGGDGGSSGSNLEGDPITAMTITTVDFNGASFPQTFAAAKAYEQYINDNGGINGRPLEVLTCDDKGTAAAAEACAREAIDKKVVAVVGSAGFYGANIQAILSPAKISFFGTCCGFAPVEFEDPMAFTFGPDPVSSNAALLIQMMDDGCQQISELTVELPVTDDINEGSAAVLDAAGYTGELNFVKYPGVSQDYSTEVSKAVAGDADCIGIFGNDQHWAAMLPAIFAAGSEAQLYGFKGNLSPTSARGFEDEDQVTSGTIMSPYADISDDAYADFRQALEDSGAEEDLDYNSLAGLGAWTGYEAFTQVVEGISGEITAQAFVDQATKTVIDNGGQTAEIDLTKSLTGGVPPYDKRVFNRTYFAQNYDGSPKATIDIQTYIDKL